MLRKQDRALCLLKHPRVAQSRTRLKWLGSSRVSLHLRLGMNCYVIPRVSWIHSSQNGEQAGRIESSRRREQKCHWREITNRRRANKVSFKPLERFRYIRGLGMSETGAAAAAAKSPQLCPALWEPTDSSPPGSSVPGILQARTLERVAISFSNACMHAKVLQSCLTLCSPMHSTPPGSSVHGIL